jgi:hypothetical protein
MEDAHHDALTVAATVAGEGETEAAGAEPLPPIDRNASMTDVDPTLSDAATDQATMATTTPMTEDAATNALLQIRLACCPGKSEKATRSRSPAFQRLPPTLSLG